jgi:hypothetical protein
LGVDGFPAGFAWGICGFSSSDWRLILLKLLPSRGTGNFRVANLGEPVDSAVMLPVKTGLITGHEFRVPRIVAEGNETRVRCE